MFCSGNTNRRVFVYKMKEKSPRNQTGALFHQLSIHFGNHVYTQYSLARKIYWSIKYMYLVLVIRVPLHQWLHDFTFLIYRVRISRSPAVTYNVKVPIILHVGNIYTDNLFTGLLLPSLFHHLQSSTSFIIQSSLLFLVFASRPFQLIENNCYIQLINQIRTACAFRKYANFKYVTERFCDRN